MTDHNFEILKLGTPNVISIHLCNESEYGKEKEFETGLTDVKSITRLGFLPTLIITSTAIVTILHIFTVIIMLSDAFSATNLIIGLGVAIVYAFIHVFVDERLRVARMKRPLGSNAPVLNLKNGDYAAAAKDYNENLQNLVREGYKKFTDGVYQLWTTDGFLTIVNPKFINELKSQPTQVLDFHAAAQKVRMDSYSKRIVFVGVC